MTSETNTVLRVIIYIFWIFAYLLNLGFSNSIHHCSYLRADAQKSWLSFQKVYEPSINFNESGLEHQAISNMLKVTRDV